MVVGLRKDISRPLLITLYIKDFLACLVWEGCLPKNLALTSGLKTEFVSWNLTLVLAHVSACGWKRLDLFHSTVRESKTIFRDMNNNHCFSSQSSYAVWWDSRYCEVSAANWLWDDAGSHRATPDLVQDVPSAQFQLYSTGLEHQVRCRVSWSVKLAYSTFLPNYNWRQNFWGMPTLLWIISWAIKYQFKVYIHCLLTCYINVYTIFLNVKLV